MLQNSGNTAEMYYNKMPINICFGYCIFSGLTVNRQILIILESSALIEQWKDAVEKFLNITVPPRGVIAGRMHPNEEYEIIHNNDMRDEQIAQGAYGRFACA